MSRGKRRAPGSIVTTCRLLRRNVLPGGVVAVVLEMDHLLHLVVLLALDRQSIKTAATRFFLAFFKIVDLRSESVFSYKFKNYRETVLKRRVAELISTPSCFV